MSFRLHFCSVPSFVAATVLIAGSSLVDGQTAGQPPSNYQGPTLYGVCVYVLGDTSYYSNIFSTSGYFKIQAQDAFRKYATAQAKGAALKGEGCRWSTSKDEVTTQKETDKRLLGQAGRSAKGAETGWVFNAATAAATSTTAATTTGTTSGTKATTAATSGTTGSASNSTSTNSIAANAQSSLNATKTSATSSVNDAMTSSMNAATTGTTSAIQGLFKKKPKASGDQTQTASAAPQNGVGPQGGHPGQGAGGTQVATSQEAAPLGFSDTESPVTATAEAHHIEGLVADVAGNDLVINVGLQAGVQVGTKLMVMHPVRTVKDPATGKVLRTIEDKVGELTVTSADAASAEGKFNGATPPKVGDTVKTPTP